MKHLRIALLATAGLTTPEIAWAQCIQNGATTYMCSAANTVPQLINLTNVTVSTTPGFSIDVPMAGGSALAIVGGGNISYLDFASSSLRGGGEGLLMQTIGPSGDPGSITVDANGPISGQLHGIVTRNNSAGSTTITVTDTVTGGSRYGILSENYATTTDLTVNAAAASGGSTGIAALNTGTGATAVTATGAVSGTSIYGIVAAKGAVIFSPDGTVASVTGNNGTDLKVEAAGVSGGNSGIYAVNRGTGITSVTATGPVVGTSFFGILAQNAATGTDLTVNAAAVTGGQTGIYANNNGTGSTLIEASGLVVGTSIGIAVPTGSSTTDLTVNAAAVTGGSIGISVDNNGTGSTSIKTTGAVIGTSGEGIFAQNAATAMNLKLDVAAVTGVSTGLYAINNGRGSTLIEASGAVAGISSYGIVAQNAATATNLVANTAAVSGGDSGIVVSNLGTGSTSVTSTGAVVGTTNTGIYAETGATTTSLTMSATAASGRSTGIRTFNRGNAATSVTATGAVVGTSDYGILAQNAATATGLTVNAASANGGQIGIAAVNAGTGPTSVAVSGVVQGGNAGVFASSAGQPVDLEFAATARVHNANLSSTALATSASGGSVNLDNAGQLIGAVQLIGANNLMTNTGIWSTAGATNVLGGPTSRLVNTGTGVIVAAQSAATMETTQFQGTGTFTNRGMMSLRDGAGGDVARLGGNVSFTGTSVQAVDIGNGQADKIVVDGTANLSGSLAVSRTGGFGFVGTRYAVLSATGGLNGRYGALTGDAGAFSSFFSVVDSYDANNAYLGVVQVRPFSAAALTPNQTAVANGAQSLPVESSLYNALGNLQTDAAARVAFDQLSGEAHASARTALNEGSRMVRDAALGRLRSAFGGREMSTAPSTASVMSYGDDCGPQACQAEGGSASGSRYAVWTQGLGSWGYTEGDGNAAGLSRSNAGVLFGADASVFDVGRVGLFGGYTRTSFSVADRQSSGGSDNIHLGLYGGAQWGALGLRVGAAYSWHTLSTNRSVAFGGFTDTLKGDYKAGTFQAFGELGYRLSVDRVTFEPFANIAYANLSTDGFSERGGLAALTAAGNSSNVTTTTLGLRTAASFMLGWQHAFGDITPLASLALAGGSPFTVAGSSIARNSALVETGFDVRLSERMSLGATYTGQFASGAQDQAVRANVTLNF